ncbi:serine/threonine protein kinase [bacterium]|nr:serine/threonine protein kinase [bacterium]
MSLVGKSIGRYRVIEQLGQGGMAVVYRAYDTRLEREVALKAIRIGEIPESQRERLLKRFEREAKAQARFSHGHIVQVHDYGEYEGAPYLVMTYLPGGTLKQRVNGAVTYREAAAILSPIADALAYAHKREVLHRDVKPSNILFDGEGQPMLTDFGIAKLLGEVEEATLTGTGLGVGTPQYMAPEQWKGKPVEQTDIYALGVVFYELVTGRKPYDADTPAALILMQATEPLPQPSTHATDLPERVEQVLYKALAVNPEDRYESMAAFAQVLSELAQGAAILNEIQHVLDKPKKRATQTNEETVDELDPFSDETKERKISKKRKVIPGWVWGGVTGVVLIGGIVGGGMLLNKKDGSLYSAVAESTPTELQSSTNTSNLKIALQQELATQFAEETLATLPTATVTTIPTKTVIPTMQPAELNFQIAYTNDFEAGTADDFSMLNGRDQSVSGLQVIEDIDGNHVLQIGHEEFTKWPEIMFDYKTDYFMIEYKYKMVYCTEDCLFTFWYQSFYSNGINGYELLIQPKYRNIYLQYWNKNLDSSPSYGGASFFTKYDIWNTLKIVVDFEKTKIYINDNEYIVTNTPEVKSEGLFIATTPNTTFYIDDVTLWLPDYMIND